MESRENSLLFIYLLFDLIIINSSILFTSEFFLNINLESIKQIGPYILHANVAWVITYFVIVKERFHITNELHYRLLTILKRSVAFAVVSITLAFFLLPKHFSREFIIEYIAVVAAAQTVFYYLFYKYSLYKRSRKIDVNDCLIINQGDLSSTLRRVIENNPVLGYHFRGFIDDQNPNGDRVLGTTAELEEIIDRCDIRVVFAVISLFGSDKQTKEEFLHICNEKGIRLYLVPESQRWFANNRNMQTLGGITLINPQIIPLDDIGARVMKRMFDIIFSLFIIIFVFSWLFPIIAIIIKLTSPGPVFFVQRRTGINNKSFSCYKFRSMKINFESDEKQATKNDDRITPIGRFMRKTNIDEFPQFFNVLWGQMSIVGPRPHMLKHTWEYSKLIKGFKTRHYVKPGISGWAQVSGFRGETNELWKMERRVSCDMEYIHNWTFTWDLKIIWLTVFGKNALKNAG